MVECFLQNRFCFHVKACSEVQKTKKRSADWYSKEISFQEHRIALTPDSVAVLTSNGHQIMVETGAGDSANFTDTDYSEAGARIVYSAKEVYTADIIIKSQHLPMMS